MTPSTHHPEYEHAHRNHIVAKLNGRSLFLSTAILTAVLYTICVGFIALAPQAAMAFFSYILHADLTTIARPVNFGNFIVGLLAWSLGTGLYAVLIARLYNRLLVR